MRYSSSSAAATPRIMHMDARIEFFNFCDANAMNPSLLGFADSRRSPPDRW
jgi:hypothetical protein